MTEMAFSSSIIVTIQSQPVELRATGGAHEKIHAIGGAGRSRRRVA
jgi:hypothetical protein